LPSGLQSQSTPNLSTANPLRISYADESPSPERPPRTLSPSEDATPSEPTSLEDPTDDAQPNGDFLSSSSDFSSSADDDNDDAPTRSTDVAGSPRRPHSGHSSRSHTHLPPSSSTLFPPFYNRPPTPLPPSPSLTSLLRGGPPFSAAASRPTTPETSDAESHGGGGRGGGERGSGTGASSSTGRRAWAGDGDAAAAAPPPPKIPAYEYYGFALYLASAAAFLMFLAWAYLPSALLHQLGVYYFPDRWWALAVPAWLVVAGLWIYVALASYNGGYLTLRLESAECMVDECAFVAVLDSAGRIVKRRERAPLAPPWLREKTGVDAAGGRKGKRRVGHRRHDSRESKKERERDFGLLGKDLDWKALWSEGTDAVMDVPIGGVCEILYGAGRDELQRANE